MQHRELSLGWLLAPLTVDTFLEDVWGTTHYHVKRDSPGYFDSLLDGSASIDELVGLLRPDLSLFGMVRGDDKKQPYLYRRPDGTFDAERVGKDFADGYTIVLESVQRYVRALAALLHSLEVELNYPAQVNAYITRPESRGFVCHYDDHDVLILQIRGSKLWHVYDGADVAPHRMSRHDPVDPSALPPPTDVHLGTGDLLYLPRGRVHAAEATTEVSVHLTLGLQAPTLLMLVTRALNALSYSDDRVHTQLPPRYLNAPEVRAGLSTLVRGVAEALEEPGTVAAGIDSLDDDLVRRGLSPPVGQALSNAVGIDGRSRVTKYQPLYSRVTDVPDGVTLHFAQLTVKAAADHADALRFVSDSTAPFRVCDLPGLSAAQQAELARSLIVSGFLVRLPD
ncbi:hypothetical protein GCM10009641_54600 [Mycobacterium cookii]|uniref:JmjC domain-containing protein n=1 Tax=Mycobacterium cookii TaxID=1775 RepID=A0A7I7KQP3_9MYCO|nr:cupin domain-containing protein [Mycobacterium cookii]MCV7332498.1 cupin [Mycobacterium cookii]BBX44480.1 hypothetical protein MCOO_04950 [Mycobacterium cookii]